MSISVGAVETEDLIGTTDQFSGSVGTSNANVPASAGNVIAEALVRCSSDQANSRRLSVSFDGGTTFLVLSPGEFVGWGTKGGLTQIVIKGNVASVDYEVILNREP
jgi:hypothetical protein